MDILSSACEIVPLLVKSSVYEAVTFVKLLHGMSTANSTYARKFADAGETLAPLRLIAVEAPLGAGMDMLA
jgi:hypothetical protein